MAKQSGYSQIRNAPGFSPQPVGSEADYEIKYLKSKLEHLEYKNKLLEKRLANGELVNTISSTGSHLDDISMQSRICQLENKLHEKDKHIEKLTEDMNSLLEKQKKFVASNCSLQDEMESLRTELENTKRNLDCALTENKTAKHHLENNEMLLELLKSPPSENLDGETNNSQGEYTSSVSDGLRQAVQFALQQQKELRCLQETVLHQNIKIKELIQQLNGRPQVTVAINDKYHDFTFLTPECEPSKPAQETNYQASSNTNDPRFKNIYGVGITTSLNEDAEPNLDDPNPTLNNDPKVIDVGFHSPRLELQGRGVAGGRGGVQVASEIIGIPARTNTKTTTPKPEERTCPLCSVSFHGFLEDFEQHVDQCLTLSTAAIVSCDQERHCPMCSKVFPKEIPQSEFEGHVEHHFGNGGCDFEQLNIIG